MANIIVNDIWVIFKWEDNKMISYTPFWNTLKKKQISQYQLINKYKVSAGQLSRMRKNDDISTHTINMLCEILDCRVEDIVVFEKE